MILNNSSLTTLGVGFRTSFQAGLDQHAAQWERVATRVGSTTAREEYGWLGKWPGMREWVGDRVVNALAKHGYAIRNKDWESTVEVERNDIEDDNLGIYGPMFVEQGRAAAAHRDEMVWPLLTNGFAETCYDSQFFFDSDHPVIQADGSVASVSNTGGGSGTPWFLLDTSRALKPLILQVRKEPTFVAKDRITDDNLFWQKTFVYGVDDRKNVGYGFWQMAYGSKATLDATSFNAAYAAMQGMKGDYGRPLGLMPNLLVVPPSLRGTGLELLKAQRGANGATNINEGAAELLVVPWLA